MELNEKLRILGDAAKYDAACTSSGADRKGSRGSMGSACASGICHSFAGDGRCISLLKVLLSNACAYDCAYCVNRRSNDIPRTSFTPRELADLTMQFYRRNYIEGLFLSSGVIGTPDNTCEKMIAVLRILREEYRFRGYIHAKAIPGADPILIRQLGLLADRMSVNIEMPSSASLTQLAPNKTKKAILAPMGYMRQRIEENSRDLVRYRHAPKFAPAGQSTQMIIGASPETDYHILKLSEGLYRRYGLKRVFFSAYVPVVPHPLLPGAGTPPPLWREHRLYQADWLLRFYGFAADELLDEEHAALHPYLDPKCHWALRHSGLFPLEVNRASHEELLRVPGIGAKSAWRILQARRACPISWDALEKIGVVVKRAQYFLLCRGKKKPGLETKRSTLLAAMMSERERKRYLLESGDVQQLSLFEPESARFLSAHREMESLPLPM
ncbi:MAG: putative DNA modification/repair radical SAM protein [Selenomonadaceae bacterium]|nr:putative DNA modification/repair radical SAM protein [Selenomonadaceae bacterium]